MTDEPWPAVAVLVDPVRRALYEYVRRQDHAVNREEAASATGISRHLSAFHLDKLVETGLLHARYEAPPDRQRGRGRTPKVYEPAGGGLSLTVPPRRYELLGEILADAVARRPDDARVAAEENAFEHGRAIGTACQARPTAGADVDAELAATYAALAELGFEPRTGDGVSLGNCPFHALAQRQPQLICGLNQMFVRGLLAGLGTGRLDTRLQPDPGACCVRIAPADPPPAPERADAPKPAHAPSHGGTRRRRPSAS